MEFFENEGDALYAFSDAQSDDSVHSAHLWQRIKSATRSTPSPDTPSQ